MAVEKGRRIYSHQAKGNGILGTIYTRTGYLWTDGWYKVTAEKSLRGDRWANDTSFGLEDVLIFPQRRSDGKH